MVILMENFRVKCLERVIKWIIPEGTEYGIRMGKMDGLVSVCNE